MPSIVIQDLINWRPSLWTSFDSFHSSSPILYRLSFTQQQHSHISSLSNTHFPINSLPLP